MGCKNDSDITGWITVGGRRIPLRKKSGEIDRRNKIERGMAKSASYLNSRIPPKKSDLKMASKEADEKSRHYKGKDIAVEKYYDTYEPSVAKYKGIVGKRNEDGSFIGKKEQKGFLSEGEADRWGVGTISEDNRRSGLRKNANRLGRKKVKR